MVYVTVVIINVRPISNDKIGQFFLLFFYTDEFCLRLLQQPYYHYKRCKAFTHITAETPEKLPFVVFDVLLMYSTVSSTLEEISSNRLYQQYFINKKGMIVLFIVFIQKLKNSKQECRNVELKACKCHYQGIIITVIINKWLSNHEF